MKADEIMQFFTYEHLPEKLQKISKPFANLASEMYVHLPDNEEKVGALRKLLEAKDCAVRSFIYVDPSTIKAEPATDEPIEQDRIVIDEDDKVADL